MAKPITSVFALTAFILMWVGSLNCNFIKFTDTSGTSEPVSLEFGIWSYRSWSFVYSTSGSFVLEHCRSYPDSTELDDSWKAARAFDAITFALAVFCLVSVCVTSCATDNRTVTYGWEAPMYLLTALCQGLTLLFLNSNACNDNHLVQTQDKFLGDSVVFPSACSMSTGAKLTISSTVLFFISAVLSFVSHRREKEIEKEERGDLIKPLGA